MESLISQAGGLQSFLHEARKLYMVSREWGFLLNPRSMLDITKINCKYTYLVETVKQAKQLCDDGTIRDRIKQIPLLEIEEEECAVLAELHLIYGILVNCYVWSQGEDNSPDVIPANLAVPFVFLSDKLGLLPAISHADLMLCNCVLVDTEGPLDISNLKLKYSLSGFEFKMDWFFCVTGQVELDCAAIITTIFECYYYMLNEDIECLISSFSKLPALINKVESSFRLMHKHLDAKRFYNELRPYLNGWHSKGKIYEGVSTEPIKVFGGSAAQASGIQCIDSFLGIQHSQDKREFLSEMKDYMPPPHRKLINDIQSMSMNMQKYGACLDRRGVLIKQLTVSKKS